MGTARTKPIRLMAGLSGPAWLGLALAACASAPKLGPIGESPTSPIRITAIDSTHPPRWLSAQLDEQSYVAVLLVAAGHSATLLYPPDSTTNNQLPAGQHTLNVTVPAVLLESDSARIAGLIRARDSSRVRTRVPTVRTPALQPTTPTYFLVVTSPQPLSYSRIVAKTTGVSIPTLDLEALNAVGKAVKSTIEADPRVWNGFYQLVKLFPPT